MLSLIQESHDPHFNLAAEEYLLYERQEDFVVLSVNDPSVIMGKHQVGHREVNTRFTDNNNIPVLRRISGGGTVYHDRGNLNFAFIRQSEHGKQVDFRLYTRPVIDFLGSLGITAVFERKNDLTVGGLKVSGNAEHIFRDRVLHHGTLLFDASVEDMRQVIKPDQNNYSSRGVESRRSPVTNLRPKLEAIETIDRFRSEMLGFFYRTIDDITPFTFSAEEIGKINIRAESRYKTWEWNWGYGPPYTFTACFNISGMIHSCRLSVRDGIIWECEIGGGKEIAAAGKKLIGCRHMAEDIRRVFRTENITLSDEEIFGFF